MNNLAVLMVTCDKYSHLWDSWFQNYLDVLNLDLPICQVNEKKKTELPISQIRVNYPIEKWTGRIREALKVIPYDNIFLWLDDLFFTRNIEWKFKKLYRIFKENNFDSLRFEYHRNKKVIIEKAEIFNGLIIEKLSDNSWYKISYMPCFWKKDFLLKCLSIDESPWDSELKGSWRISGNINQFYDEGIIVNVYKQGKLTKEGEEMLKNYES